MSNARDIADAGHKLKAFTRFNGADVTASSTDKSDLKNYFGIDGVEDQGQGQYKIHLTSGTVSNANYLVVVGYIPDYFFNSGSSASARLTLVKTTDANYVEIQSGYMAANSVGFLDFDISVAIFV